MPFLEIAIDESSDNEIEKDNDSEDDQEKIQVTHQKHTASAVEMQLMLCQIMEEEN